MRDAQETSAPEGGWSRYEADEDPSGRGRISSTVGLHAAMAAALSSTRRATSPNPLVGCHLRAAADGAGGSVLGWTQPPGGMHAEAHALRRAAEDGIDLRGGTAYVTLEPCSHHGRTPPCADALIAAGIARVVIGILDPDPNVAGRGVERLRAAGVEVAMAADIGADDAAAAIEDDLEAYLHHRRTGRPFVTLKLATSLDGRTAAPDGSSQWITGPAARADVQRLRGSHDAILVGAGTVRADDPRLTVREPEDGPDPRRIVLGTAPGGAKVHPCTEEGGPLPDVLGRLGADGVTSLLVEGGASVARSFHQAGLVDRYVLYLAPALFGGDDGRPVFAGPGAATIADVWRGRIERTRQIGADLRIDLVPNVPARPENGAT